MTDALQILVVCTANICRSPAAAAMLSHELTDRFGAAVRVASAGTDAVQGAPPCELSTALVGTYPSRAGGTGPLDYGDHRSRPVAADAVAASDLVLGLDRTHRARLAQLAPAARSRTFTLRQAGAIAADVAQQVAAGRLPSGAPDLPERPVARLRWLIGELDAGRGLPPPPDGQTGPGADDGMQWHPHDIPDPHVVGYQVHPMAVELIEGAVRDITASLDTILAAPIPFQPHLPPSMRDRPTGGTCG